MGILVAGLNPRADASSEQWRYIIDHTRGDLVAPAVGWLAHESCGITGEVLAAIAGRIARIAIAESRGVYRPHWSIEDVAADIDRIRFLDDPVIYPVVPDGHNRHIADSFARAAAGAPAAEAHA